MFIIVITYDLYRLIEFEGQKKIWMSCNYNNSLMKKHKHFARVLGEIRPNHNSLFSTITCSLLPEYPQSP